MLVLSRQKNESIVCGENGEVEIIIIDVRGDKVRLGTIAPNMPIHREEVFRKIVAEMAKGVTEIPLEKKQTDQKGFLVLSRQKDESIVIGRDIDIEKNIKVMIVDVRGDKVRLGITAPKDTPVHRREIFEAIQREKSEK